MIARAVNAAADVIHRAQVSGAQTAAGLAMALEAAQMLVSPELAHEQAAVEAERDALKARVAELEAQLSARERPVDEDPITYALTDKAATVEDVTPQVSKLRALLAGQRAVVEDPLGLHHDYRLGRDLPQAGDR
ncbi:hypothetical protein [Streptomyces sp. NPDC057257]|uniref:hypothetical protein n=1 Tax=Streptomyces sp. NPDC057257 TaxID=3346071 RepID=UPI003625B6D0